MCGIFGVIRQTGDVDVSAALRVLGHRGPDEQGVWRSADAVLGHTRLGRHRPVARSLAADGDRGRHRWCWCSTARSTTITRSARSWRAPGHRFRSRSDTEVIVEGYRAWGDEVVDRLDGMFAFGLWDVARRRLLLARDRAGKKPLFYWVANRGLRFASEVKALAASGVPMAVDVARAAVSALVRLHAGRRRLCTRVSSSCRPHRC